MANYSQGLKQPQAAKNSNLMKASSASWFRDLIIITGLLALAYFLGLGSYPLFTPDEGRYSEVAREMIVTHDFITPRLNGVVFLDKPILYYWLQASAMKMFGLNEAALRFWPAVFGIFGCLSMYLGGRLLFNRRSGIISALLLATSVLYYGAAHYANLDLEVAVLVSTTLLFFLLGLKAPQTQQSRLWIYAAYLFAGLAILTKGLIGIAFPVMIIGSWTLLLGKWDNIKKVRPFSGLMIMLAIVLPWYIQAQMANPEFFHFFFIVQQISRFLSTNDFNNQVPWWFYFPIVLAGFLPWTLFIFSTLIKNCRQIWQNRQQQATPLYLMLWVFLIFIFFSIPHSKTIGYILPIFPALALLVGNYLDQAWETFFSSGKGWQALFLPLSFAFFALACFGASSVKALEVMPALLPYLKSAGLCFTLTTLILLYFYTRKNFAALCSSIFISALVFFCILVSSASIINQNSTKALALQIKSGLSDKDEIVTFYKYFQDLPLYLEKRITIVADWEDPGIPHNDNWLRELWYGKSFQDTQAWLINEAKFWKRWNSHKRVYVLTNLKYYDTFKSKAKARFYLLGQENETVLITNIPA
jgi:hypothetical protein